MQRSLVSQPMENSTYTLKSFRISKDSTVRRQARNDANATSFEYVSTNENDKQEIQAPVVTVGLIADRKYEYDRRIVKAALNALNGMLPAKIIVEEIPAKALTADWRVWLSDKEAVSGKIIVLKPSEDPDLVVQTGPSTGD